MNHVHGEHHAVSLEDGSAHVVVDHGDEDLLETDDLVLWALIFLDSI